MSEICKLTSKLGLNKVPPIIYYNYLYVYGWWDGDSYDENDDEILCGFYIGIQVRTKRTTKYLYFGAKGEDITSLVSRSYSAKRNQEIKRKLFKTQHAAEKYAKNYFVKIK